MIYILYKSNSSFSGDLFASVMYHRLVGSFSEMSA